MRKRDVCVGMKVAHRLPGGEAGKYLGVVLERRESLVRFEAPDGTNGIATYAEIVPVEERGR